MGRCAVLQPNRKYAVFCTSVDAFVVYDMTHQEAFEFWHDYCGIRCAKDKLDRADRDVIKLSTREGDGTWRWRDGLRTMVGQGGPDGERGDEWHGLAAAKELVSDALDGELREAWLRWLDAVEFDCADDGSYSVNFPNAPKVDP